MRSIGLCLLLLGALALVAIPSRADDPTSDNAVGGARSSSDPNSQIGISLGNATHTNSWIDPNPVLSGNRKAGTGETLVPPTGGAITDTVGIGGRITADRPSVYTPRSLHGAKAWENTLGTLDTNLPADGLVHPLPSRHYHFHRSHRSRESEVELGSGDKSHRKSFPSLSAEAGTPDDTATPPQPFLPAAFSQTYPVVPKEHELNVVGLVLLGALALGGILLFQLRR